MTMKAILFFAVLGQLTFAAVMNEPRANPSSTHRTTSTRHTSSSSTHHTSSQHSSTHHTSSQHSSTHSISSKHTSTSPTSSHHSTTHHPSSASSSHTTTSSSTSTGPGSMSSISYSTGPAPVVCTDPPQLNRPIVKNGGFADDYLAHWTVAPVTANTDYDYGLLADTSNTNSFIYYNVDSPTLTLSQSICLVYGQRYLYNFHSGYRPYSTSDKGSPGCTIELSFNGDVVYGPAEVCGGAGNPDCQEPGGGFDVDGPDSNSPASKYQGITGYYVAKGKTEPTEMRFRWVCHKPDSGTEGFLDAISVVPAYAGPDN